MFSLGRQNGEAIGEYVEKSNTYARQADEQIKECIAFTDDALKSVCIREVVDATNENERAESDLVAQTEMSLWALCMLIATIIMTLITAAGVWFVKGTLEQSMLATKAAQAAVAATQESSRDANRAYVDVDAVIFYWGSRTGQRLPMILDLYKAEKQSNNSNHHSSPRPLGAFDT